MRLVMVMGQVLVMLLEALVDLTVVQVVKAVAPHMLDKLTTVYIHHDCMVVAEERTELSQLVMEAGLST